jgi:hypothetical protein
MKSTQVSKRPIFEKDLPVFENHITEFTYFTSQNPQFTPKQLEELEKVFDAVIHKKFTVKRNK